MSLLAIGATGASDMARLVYSSLQRRGYSVFMDVEGLKSGLFNTALFEAIDSATDFVVVLCPNSLDRCNDKGDWLRLEVAFAIKRRRKTSFPL